MLPHHTLFFNSFAADAHVGEQVRFGDPVGTSHFQTADRSRTEQLVAGLGADAEYFADLFHAHDVGVFPEHDFVSIALGHGRYAHFDFSSHIIMLLKGLREKLTAVFGGI